MKPVLRYQSQLLFRRSYKPFRAMRIRPTGKVNIVFRPAKRFGLKPQLTTQLAPCPSWVPECRNGTAANGGCAGIRVSNIEERDSARLYPLLNQPYVTGGIHHGGLPIAVIIILHGTGFPGAGGNPVS